MELDLKFSGSGAELSNKFILCVISLLCEDFLRLCYVDLAFFTPAQYVQNLTARDSGRTLRARPSPFIVMLLPVPVPVPVRWEMQALESLSNK
ncbi:hypothetical protein SCA6_014875 [Theobroma cacao]